MGMTAKDRKRGRKVGMGYHTMSFRQKEKARKLFEEKHSDVARSEVERLFNPSKPCSARWIANLEETGFINKHHAVDYHVNSFVEQGEPFTVNDVKKEIPFSINESAVTAAITRLLGEKIFSPLDVERTFIHNPSSQKIRLPIKRLLKGLLITGTPFTMNTLRKKTNIVFLPLNVIGHVVADLIQKNKSLTWTRFYTFFSLGKEARELANFKDNIGREVRPRKSPERQNPSSEYKKQLSSVIKTLNKSCNDLGHSPDIELQAVIDLLDEKNRIGHLNKLKSSIDLRAFLELKKRVNQKI